MKLTTGLAAAALTAATVFATIPVAAAATATAKTVVDSKDDLWQDMTVKPEKISFGNGGSPFITNLTWHSWTATTAYGEGKLHVQKPCNLPSYECTAYSVRWASVRLTSTKLHNGRPYFSKMAIVFYRSGKITRRLTDLHGYWTGKALWPYFG